MLWCAVQNTSIDEIEHVFFVRGHSENESDGIHARIEKASRHLDIYSTSQWATVIQGAKVRPPFYKVKEMSQDDFSDFKLVSKRFANTNMDTERERVRWLKIRKYCVSKAEPNAVMISYELDGEQVEMNVAQKVRRRSSELSANFDLQNAYVSPLPLT